MRKKIGGKLIRKNRTRPKKKVLLYYLQQKSHHFSQKSIKSKDQKKYGDTLVCRDTPVEKHGSSCCYIMS